jgi:UDP-N-acetylglucosamine--N-acetylmuramyl-(pentapeptide) pyrophosphoryl-undecaprenol N-acetylglucosamine transferase
VYPAQSVLQALGSNAKPVLWVGGQGGMEADLVSRLNVTYTDIPAAGVHGVGLRALPGNVLKLVQGTLAARRILNSFKPQVLLFTGGYVAAPMAVVHGGTPTLLYVPDIEPGLALKFLARFANCIAVTAEESRRYFSPRARVVVTGYPVRPDLQPVAKGEARSRLGLQADQPALLVFGGSKGARSINRAITSALPQLLAETQVLHLSGNLDWPEVSTVQQTLPANLRDRYHAFPYLHEEMGLALASADLVISRAGASCLGEFPLYGLPAVLIPYPYAWRYQRVNAAHLVDHSAAVMIEDGRMAADLIPTLLDLLRSPEKLRSMRAAMLSLAKPDASARLANLVRELAGEPVEALQ